MGAGNSSNTSQTTSNTASSAAQTPYLNSAFQDAQNIYNQNMAQGPYQGNYVAPTNAAQTNAYTGAYNAAEGLQGTNNSIIGQGSNAANTGLGGASSALGGLGNFGTTNGTAATTGAAGQFASGFNVPAEVQAATRQAQEQAADTTLPNLYRGASAEGNINSDRTAISQGLVNQGLAENAQTLGATLANQDYGTGLSAAQTGNSQQLQALGLQGSLGSSLGSTGLNAETTGINNQGNLDNQATAGANGLQQLDQSNLNNTIQKYAQQQGFSTQQLQNLMNIVGGKSWGSSGTTDSTTQQNPSAMSTVGSGIGAIGSLLSLF